MNYDTFYHFLGVYYDTSAGTEFYNFQSDLSSYPFPQGTGVCYTNISPNTVCAYMPSSSSSWFCPTGYFLKGRF
jgi:hypothetical protein